MTLAELMDEAEGMARVALKNDGQAGTCAVIEAAGHEGLGIVPLRWDDRPGHKAFVMSMVRAAFRELGVTAYAVWSECWMATRKAGPEVALGEAWDGVMPRDDPNRAEGLVIVGVEKGKPPVSRFWQMKRRGDEVDLERMEEADGVGGPLADLLMDDA